MRRGDIVTVSGGVYARKPRPALVVQDDRFDATESVTICPLTAPRLQLLPPVDASVYTTYGCGVGETTTIRISRDTHARVTRLAAERHETIDQTVSKAIRALRQDAMARDLAGALTDDETAWLDADAG